MGRNRNPYQLHLVSPMAQSWARFFSLYILMICLMRSAPGWDYLLMIQPCTSPWKARMTAQHYKLTWAYCLHGRPGGIWSSTPQSVKWCMWLAPERRLRLTMYYMDRFWSLSHVLGIAGLISPAHLEFPYRPCNCQCKSDSWVYPAKYKN